jgi:hypothetical protein
LARAITNSLLLPREGQKRQNPPMKTNTLSLILVYLLTGFAFLQPAHSATNVTAFGDGALEANQGNNNSAFGHSALRGNIFGRQNTAVGAFALNKNDLGEENTAIGFQALFSNNTSGSRNTATGQSALQHNDRGSNNTATGVAALYRNTNGGNNTAIGFFSLDQNTTGSFNVALGDHAGSGVITANDVICIGRAVSGANVNGTCFIGNIRGVHTQNANALPVVIDGAGQLGTVASSERFKKDITTMEKASEGILSLRPVTFHYKTDGTSTPQFGLIAEEVAKVNPALVLPDKEGKPYTVRYDAVNAMLLNEFLKEHSKVEKLEATIAKQHKDFEAALADLKGQIQKVSAQLELNKPAPQTVLNNQ